MAITDAPDGTLWVQQVTVVVDTPTPPEPANESPIAEVGRYSGTDTTYQEICSWTITAAKSGKLKEVSITTDQFTKTYFRLEIAGSAIFEDVTIQEALTVPFGDLPLAAGSAVTLSAKSSDGTSINADGEIAGKEIG